jgi:peptidyl-tRNA hydrolase, PTH1 family
MKFLVAGLGNIGPEYANTRHNIGFMAVDALAEKHHVAFSPARYGDKAEFRHKGRIFILIKPSTYMNLSGRPVYYWMEKEKIDLENLLVITDDLALPPAYLRLRSKGGAGGHNGLENIIEVLGTNMFARLRFGIGGDYPRGFQSQYVLGKWEDDEWPVIQSGLDVTCDIVISFALQGVGRTMNLYNKRK